MKSLNLTEIIEAVSARNEDAWKELQERFKSKFLGFAFISLYEKGCGAPDQDAPDVAAEAWLKIFKKINTLKDRALFEGWAHEIIRNLAADHSDKCRKRKQKERSLESLNKKSSDESGDKEITFDPPRLVDDARVIFDAILRDETLRIAKEISQTLYNILCMRLDEDLDWDEISERIGESYDTTRNIYYRGIRKLRKRLDEEKKRRRKDK